MNNQIPISQTVVTQTMIEEYRQAKRVTEDLLLQTDRAIEAGIALEAQKAQLQEQLVKINKFLKVYG